MQMRYVPTRFQENRPVQARTTVQFTSKPRAPRPAKFPRNAKVHCQLPPTCRKWFIFIDFNLRFRIYTEDHENQRGDLYETHQLLVYADDVKSLRENLNVKKESTEILLDVIKEDRSRN